MMETDQDQKEKRPQCHFKPMELAFADDGNSQVSFWVCNYCGHTIEIDRTYGAV